MGYIDLMASIGYNAFIGINKTALEVFEYCFLDLAIGRKKHIA